MERSSGWRKPIEYLLAPRLPLERDFSLCLQGLIYSGLPWAPLQAFGLSNSPPEVAHAPEDACLHRQQDAAVVRRHADFRFLHERPQTIAKIKLRDGNILRLCRGQNFIPAGLAILRQQ